MTMLTLQANPAAREIARTAARLFATKGYDATSVREIVEAAGVAKPTLYYYFGSKEGVAQALLTLPLERLVAELKRIVATVPDPVEALIQSLELQFGLCREDPDWARFMYSVMFGPLSNEICGEFCEHKGDMMALIDSSIRRLAETGVIASDQVDAFSTMCRGLLLVGTLDFLYHERPLPLDFARCNIERLLLGFAAPGRRDISKETL